MPHESVRLADVVRATRKRISEGGESNRPQGTMVIYEDIEKVFDFYESIALRLQAGHSLLIQPGSGHAIEIEALLEGGD